MTYAPYIGLDFGTSNSTLGVVQNGEAKLMMLEQDKHTLPSALFFAFEENKTFVGRQAIEEYTAGEFGRFMRSLKSILGTPLMHSETQIKNKHVKFLDIITLFLKEMKQRAEEEAGKPLNQVVMGRPVHFIDNNPEADQAAEDGLRSAAQNAGFTDILFQFEPIAAALDYESTLKSEEIALIVDIGGGTSDFSIVHLSPQKAAKYDRSVDILSTGGVHIGGTDFDKNLSLQSVMPHFGYGTPYKENAAQEMPRSFYHDLATWHKIHFMYERETLIAIKHLAHQARDKNLIERLTHVLEEKEGHLIALGVEGCKIDLTSAEKASINLSFVEQGLIIENSRTNFEIAIHAEMGRIKQALEKLLIDAGLQPKQVSKIFLTGGSSTIPYLQKTVRSVFPETPLVEGDQFASVGKGLTLDALRKFG